MHGYLRSQIVQIILDYLIKSNMDLVNITQKLSNEVIKLITTDFPPNVFISQALFNGLFRCYFCWNFP